jgi:hypothetical protein
MKRGSSLLGLTILMLAGLPLTAGAVPIALTPGPGVYQQTQNNPCVIGNPSCNNPAGFEFTTLPVSPTLPQITTSPTYTVDQIRTLLGGSNTFFIGVDISQAQGQGQGEYLLNSFTVNVGGTDAFKFEGPQGFTSSGNGFSDFVLTTVDLTSFASSANVFFTVNFSNDTGAREQFFLASTDAPPAPVPEPTTLVLLGTTLAGVGFVRRRYTKRDR